MTIWKSKDEAPQGEGSVFIEIRGETGSFVIASDTLNMIFFNFVRWCWEKDLLAQDKRVEELEEKLDIAVKALEEYMTFCRHPAQEALAKIKEIK